MSNPHAVDWMLILVCAPGQPAESAGVLVLDRDSNQLFARLKPSLNQTDEDILEVWKHLSADLASRAKESGGAEVVNWLETTASHVFQVSETKRVDAVDVGKALEQLFAEHVS